MQHGALGKGLAALIPDKVNFLNQEPTTSLSGDIVRIKTSQVRDNALQPRTNYDSEKLEELKSSIREKGILQPILVRPIDNGFEVVAGERRLRAARELGLEDVPAMVRNVSAEESLVLALIENVQREDLNPIEAAQAFRRLADEFHLSHDDIAQAVGKDRSTISNMLRLLNLPDEIQSAVMDGTISMGHARALLAFEDLAVQKKFFEQLVSKGMSVRELENVINTQIEGTVRKKILKVRPHDHELRLLEEELQQTLGTKVSILSKNKRGKIIIEFYSLDDCDRILNIIKKT